jgi:hypothetical protein
MKTEQTNIKVKSKRRGMEKPIRKEGEGIKQGPAGV